MSIGTGGVNRPVGSDTESGTVNNGHSVGTQKFNGEGVPTRLEAP